MRVSKWGNSLGVRLPAALVRELELKDGDEIELRVARAGESRARELEVTRAPSDEELLERVRRLRGRLPASFTFDREESHAR